MASVHAIIGFGVTGRSVARHLLRKDIPFVVFDTRPAQPLPEEFTGVDVHWLIEQWPAARIHEYLRDVARLVVSPGIPLDLSILSAARSLNLPVVSDIDLFFEATTAPVIGVTGTNGKSTVVALVGHLLNGSGQDCGVGGNIGPAALDLLVHPQQRYVLELSSFQLERSAVLPLTAATVLNISDDHLDHHGSLQKYLCAKLKIYRGAQRCIFNRADSLTRPAGSGGSVSFGLDAASDANSFGIELRAGVRWITKGDELILPADELQLKGTHNLLNVMAALALVEPAIEAQAAAPIAVGFSSLDHRFQFVRTLDGVTYINDSKATNVGATLAALHGLAPATRTILIAGGDAKGADLQPLAAALAESAAGVVALGKDAKAVAAVAESLAIDCVQVANMTDAVLAAQRMAAGAGMVLLSPACSSLDMYRNFTERGEIFARVVHGLSSGVQGEDAC